MVKKFKLTIYSKLNSGDILTTENGTQIIVLPRPWYIRFIYWISFGKWCKKTNIYTVKLLK